MNITNPLKFYKLFPEAFLPEWGSTHAACFDFKACLIAGTDITVYRETNEKIHNTVGREMTDETTVKSYLNIFPGERVMVPTGIIMDIPLGYSVRIHPRSGLSLKSGLVLANQEGVVDADYVEPTFILLHNQSTAMATIYHGDKIAQGEMVVAIKYNTQETPDKPQQKSERAGGFGSTGR
jgi:dUTP pyrophosphatase